MTSRSKPCTAPARLAVAMLVGCGCVAIAAAAKPAATPPFAPLPEDEAAACGAAFGGAATDWEVAVRRRGGKQGPTVAIRGTDDALHRGPVVLTETPLTLRRREPLDRGVFRCRVRFGPEIGIRPGKIAVQLVGAAAAADAAAKPLEFSLQAPPKGDVIGMALAGRRAAYRLKAYPVIMPTWPEAVRHPIEAAMAGLPGREDHWFDLRCEIAAGSAAFWVDDRFVGREALPSPGVVVAVQASPGVRLAGAGVEPHAGAEDEFLPVGLDGYARDSILVEGQPLAESSLPFGRTTVVDGVPFRFVSRQTASGADHIDLGHSLFRQGNVEGYEPTNGPGLGGPFSVDPARIQLALPNGGYDAIHVIAGFDGGAEAVPLMTASFYRPQAGFHEIFSARVPGVGESASAAATPVPVRLTKGAAKNLWHVRIPLDPGRLAAFSDLAAVELELAKEMRQYRGYPDPIVYGWRPAGRPSGVHVYALTLHRAPVRMSIEPARFGHVWTAPERPAYEVVLSNRTAAARRLSFDVETTSHDGGETWRDARSVTVPAQGESRITVSPQVQRHGVHAIAFAVRDGADGWVERRHFARLAPDTRAAAWQEDRGPLFGYWSYHGGHATPPAADIMRVMRMAGARAVVHRPPDPEARELFAEWGWREGSYAQAVSGPVRGWGEREPDAAEVAAFQERLVATIRAKQGDDPEVVSLFAEPQISRDLTTGSPPEWWGDPPAVPDAAERTAVAAFMRTARAAAEAVRRTWPKARLLIPWGDPLFIVPFLRGGFPRELIDGSAIDMIGFERLPEQQIHQMSTHRLFFLRDEYRKFGMPDPDIDFMEGVFVPTEPGSCTWEEQADRYHRTTLLALAHGVRRFYSGWFAYDCGGWYGAEHYGGCGIQRRIPFCDPKPGYAHYATLTRMLDGASFDRWIPTGSHSVYCLRFTRPQGGAALAIWTIRGRRPVTLATTAKAARLIDAMDNDREVAATDGRVTLVAGPAPTYVTGVEDLPGIKLGEPDHADAVAWSRGRNRETWQSGPDRGGPAAVHELTVARPGDGSWSVAGGSDQAYETNNYDTKRAAAPMTARVVEDPGHDGPALAVHFEPPDQRRVTMPWYTRLVPRQPVTIPGKADALGIRVRAQSDWGRVVYCLVDAQGERWISTGRKDAWTCDDPHGWSSFCFDGWRYLRFELPSHSEWDGFRELGTTWWGSYGGDRVVDLPLRLESLVVERRSHVMYVNDPQPANTADVVLGDIVAEYADEAAATPAAVALNRLRMPLPAGNGPRDNPIARMREAASDLPPVTLEKVTMPDWGYDGTRCHVHFTPAAVPATYDVWVAAYPDGRGAVSLAKMRQSGGIVEGLRPAMKLHLWVTYTEQPAKSVGKEKPVVRSSPPSNRLDVELVDEFGMK